MYGKRQLFSVFIDRCHSKCEAYLHTAAVIIKFINQLTSLFTNMPIIYITDDKDDMSKKANTAGIHNTSS